MTFKPAPRSCASSCSSRSSAANSPHSPRPPLPARADLLMALLQIAEPGMSAAPHEHRLVVGIDLGTTNSLVATIRHGLPEVLGDDAGRPLLPSVVHFGADG